MPRLHPPFPSQEIPPLPPGVSPLPEQYREDLPPQGANSPDEFSEVAATAVSPHPAESYTPRHVRVEESIPALVGLRRVVTALRLKHIGAKVKKLREDREVFDHVATSLIDGKGYLDSNDPQRPITRRQRHVASRLQKLAENERRSRNVSDHLRKSYGNDLWTPAQKDRLKSGRYKRNEKKAERSMGTFAEYRWPNWRRRRNRDRIYGHIRNRDPYAAHTSLGEELPINRDPGEPIMSRTQRKYTKLSRKGDQLIDRAQRLADLRQEKKRRQQERKDDRHYTPRHARTP